MSERAEELEMENIEIHKDEENQVKLEEKSESPARPEFLVTWTDLEYVVKVKKEEKTILSKVSGIAKPGEFLAIMVRVFFIKKILFSCMVSQCFEL